jgi:Uma2 family endonuclease
MSVGPESGLLNSTAMSAAAPLRFCADAGEAPLDPETIDQRVILRGVPWAQFEALVGARGDAAGVRMFYLDGDLELMSPSWSHEEIKKTIARLLEAYADTLGLELNGYGSWTLKNKRRKRGAEPDECYLLSAERPKATTKPDLAIEVVWTSGGLDKLAIYQGLGVREVWVWERPNILSVFLLGGNGYRRAKKSALLPGLDPKRLASFLERPTQSQAVRALRAELATRRSASNKKA